MATANGILAALTDLNQKVDRLSLRFDRLERNERGRFEPVNDTPELIPRRTSLLEVIPAELRLKIYRELLASPDIIDIDWKKPGLYPAIMQTCKTIFCESHPVLYGENTFMVHIGYPERPDGDRVPVCPPIRPEERPRDIPPQRWAKDLHDDTTSRSLTHSYLNDVFPQFLQGFTSNGGLVRNKAFCGAYRRTHNYEAEKLPRRLAVDAQDGCSWDDCIREQLVILSRSLRNIPHLDLLAISYGGKQRDFWQSHEGISLGRKLCTYIGGAVRGVSTVKTHNIPDVYADVLCRDMASSEPPSSLLLMCRALQDYCENIYLDNNRYLWLSRRKGLIAKAVRAMEKGNRKAFLRYRTQAMRKMHDMKSPWHPAEDVYQHDLEEDRWADLESTSSVSSSDSSSDSDSDDDDTL